MVKVPSQLKGVPPPPPSSIAKNDNPSHPVDLSGMTQGVNTRRRRVKLSMGWVADAFYRLFTFCVPDDVVEDIEEDTRVVQSVQDELLLVKRANVSEAGEAVALLNPPDKVVRDKRGAIVGVEDHVRRTKVQPRFVAQVVVALRCKLGLGAKDRAVPGNVELVRREAAKIMRSWGVRDMDASTHLMYIERCFFEDSVHDALPDWRARAARRGRLCKWLFGNSATTYDF